MRSIVVLFVVVGVALVAEVSALPSANSTRPSSCPPCPLKCKSCVNTTALNKFKTPDANEKFAGNVKIRRIVQCKDVVAGNAMALNMTVSGHLDVKGSISGELVKAKTMATDILVTGALKSDSGTVIVDGDLMITKAQAAIKSTSFIAENIVVGGVAQWKLVRHDDFEDGPAGWSLLETSSCMGSKFLGGHCHIGNGEVTKTYRNLPPHKQIRLSARYHMIDRWDGETAFLKLGEHYAWAHHADKHVAERGIEMCGNKAYRETKMSIPVEVTQAHSASFLQVSFGSKGQMNEDPCDRSFGVDDVMLYVR